MTKTLLVACLVSLLGACSGRDGVLSGGDVGDASPTEDAAPVIDGGVEAASDAVSDIPATQTVTLAACNGLNGVAESCTVVEDATACTSAPCRKLALLFSGGEEGCVTGTGYAKQMQKLATDGYAVVCINTFETAKGSDAVPYVEEAGRIDLAVKEATTSAWGARWWTGERLLFAGISHGASAPPIVMARTALDDQPSWKGTKDTAACFFDGTFDQAATASFLQTGNAGQPCTAPVSYQRWNERYCGAGASSCDLATNPKSLADSITGVAPSEYAIRKWKLIECGSATAACTSDILPAPPQQATCAKIDSGPVHACTFESMPASSHLTCFGDVFDRCGVWFDGL